MLYIIMYKLKKSKKREELRNIQNLSQYKEKTLDKRRKIYYNSRPKTEEAHQTRERWRAEVIEFFNSLWFVKSNLYKPNMRYYLTTYNM